MLQVPERLRREFGMETKLFDPDQAVAKGAAMYGLKLAIGEKIRIAEEQGVSTQQATQQVASEMGLQLPMVEKLNNTEITIVLSHSVGVVVVDSMDRELIANLVTKQTPLPRTETQRFGTKMANQQRVDIQVLENEFLDPEVQDIKMGKPIGKAALELPPGLPANSPIEITFEINGQGRLEMTAVEMTTRREVRATFQTDAGMSDAQVADATARAQLVTVR